MRTIPRILLLLLALLAILLACVDVNQTPGATQQATATPFKEHTVQGLPRSQTLVLADDEPVTLDPAIAQETASLQYVSEIFTGLVRLDDSMRVAPDLAERWDVLDNGTRYVFHLKPNAKFHSGRIVTAQDVVFSLERATDPATASPTAATYLGDIVGVGDKLSGKASKISGLRALDNATVEIRIDGPKAYFLAKLSSPVAFVVDRDNVAKGSDWYRQPNGTGPFKLKEWNKEQDLVLERNQEFYGQATGVDYVLFRFLAGSPSQMYDNGEIDITYVGPGDLDRVLDPQSPLKQDLQVYPELTIDYVGFNAAKPPFDDPLVRRAFAMAVDTGKLGEMVHQGHYTSAKGFIPPGLPGYDPNVAGIPYSPDDARKLLAQSSYGSADKLPPIVYTAPGIGGDPSPIVSAMVEMWRANLGVEVTVRQIQPDTYYYRLPDEVGNLFDFGWAADYPDPENILDVLFHTGTANNMGGYSNRQVDTLLEKARTEQEVAQRLAMYQQVQQMLLDDAAAISLWHGVTYVLVKPYVKDFAISPSGRPALERVRLELGT